MTRYLYEDFNNDALNDYYYHTFLTILPVSLPVDHFSKTAPVDIMGGVSTLLAVEGLRWHVQHRASTKGRWV